MGSFTATAIIYWQRNQWLLMRGGHSGKFLCMCDFFKEHSKTSPLWHSIQYVVKFLFTGMNVLKLNGQYKMQTGYKMQAKYKTLCLPKK